MSTLSQDNRTKLSQKRQKIVALEMKLDTLEKAELMISSLIVEDGIDLSVQFHGYTKDDEFDRPRAISTKLINLGTELPVGAKRVKEILLDEVTKKLSDLAKEIELI